MMCFQCVHFLPTEAGEMRVCVQCTELPTPGSSSHATLFTEGPGLLAIYVLSEVPRVPPFSQWCHIREENGRAQYRDERYSASPKQSTVPWKTMNFLAQLSKLTKGRDIFNWACLSLFSRVLQAYSHPTLEPGATNIAHTPSVRCQQVDVEALICISMLSWQWSIKRHGFVDPILNHSSNWL